MTKQVNITFDDDEYEKVMKLKGKEKTWKEFIFGTKTKSQKDILKDETNILFDKLQGWAVQLSNKDLHNQFIFFKSYIITALTNSDKFDKDTLKLGKKMTYGTNIGKLPKPNTKPKKKGKKARKSRK